MPTIQKTPIDIHNEQLLLWPANSIRPDAIDYRDQIIAKSRQPHICEWEPEDAEGRFKDPESYNKWAEKGRLLLGLVNNGDLGAVIYFGEKLQPDNLVGEARITFAIRMYQRLQGRGLSGAFLRAAHRIIGDNLDVSNGIWLEARSDNEVALHVYDSFGYEKVGLSSEGMVVMRYDGDKL